MKEPFNWDHYSDQPSIIRDRKFKKKMRRGELFSLIKTLLISIFILPLSFLMIPFVKRREIDSKHFFGISVNLDKNPKLSIEMIKELQVETILIRVSLWQMEKIDEFVEFAKEFRYKKVVIAILQDREHIEDLELLKEDLKTIFSKFNFVKEFQIGTTINRAKWGFFSVNEYLRFYEVAFNLQQNEFKDIRLIGSNVIDFEYHFSAHSLFTLSKIKYDILGSLLYVDRRGAPEKSQMGFDLFKKIRLLSSMVKLSPKVRDQLYITETNWPISNTAPYAPTSEHECVSEDDYADFMVRYFLIAYATQNVDAVFWHQLIASGYGLVDIRYGVRKRSAYEAFKSMIIHLKDSTVLDYSVRESLHKLRCENMHGELQVMWRSEGESEMRFYDDVDVYDTFNNLSFSKTVTLTSSPKYIYRKQI